jgi:hypothetical protein
VHEGGKYSLLTRWVVVGTSVKVEIGVGRFTVHSMGQRTVLVLSQPNIKSVGLPAKKVSSFLRSVKDNLGLRTPGVYRIPSECDKVYTGQTGRSMNTRSKEHQRHMCLEYPDKSAVVEHSVDLGHFIHFHNTSVLTTKIRYMDHIVRPLLPLSSIDFPCGPLSLPPSVLIEMGVFDWWLSLLATC